MRGLLKPILIVIGILCMTMNAGAINYSHNNSNDGFDASTAGDEPTSGENLAPVTITDMIGDNDGFGYGHAVVGDGDNLPYTDDPETGAGWLFDNRSAAEMSASDGSQATDVEENFDVTFYHSFDISQFDYLTEAFFTIDIAGLQQEVFGGLSHLYLDGVEVSEFLAINQGAWGSGLLTVAVDLAILADGALEVYFDNWDDPYADDHMAIDFTMLTVTGDTDPAIPEPATMMMLGMGLVGIGLGNKFRK